VRLALEESETRRRALFDSALDCILCTDDRGRIIACNAAAERTFRISQAAAMGNDIVETVFPPALRERHRSELFPANPSSSVEIMGHRLETSGIRSDGSEFPAEFTVNQGVVKKKTFFTIYVRDITARKRAEEKLVWLASIVESSQDAILSKGLDQKITSWNRGAEQMYGYSAEEAIGQDIAMLAPEGYGEDIRKIMRELRAGRRIKNLETVRKTKHGKLLNVSLTISPVFDEEQVVIGASIIARDITFRKSSEEALRRATETSVYASPVPIVAVDQQDRVTMWNAAAESVFGWSEQEVLGAADPLVPETEMTAAGHLHQRLMAGETLTGVEVRRRRRDGSLLTISLSSTPLWDAHHRVKGILHFLTDITARKQAETALREAEEKYRGIFENSLEGIYQTTLDGKYISANPALARILGFDSPQELILSRHDIKNQEYVDPERHAEFVRLMEKHGMVQDFEYQARRKDGSLLWVAENAHVVRDARGGIQHFEGTVQDITQQRELQHQLQQMQKIEAIGRLAGGVAHDFNNILMAVSSFAELVHRKLPAGDKSRQFVDEIMKATDRGSSLTQRLLAFSRKQVLSPKVLDLNRLIADQIDMLKRLITEDIELRFMPAAGLGNVKVDPGQIEQVVMNLVINSRDAMAQGGEIVIETDNAELDLDSRNHAAGGNYVMLAVSDNGCGMDARTKSHIFEPFFTTKEQGKGTGLGLATVFGIVKQSGGHIFVQSEPGHGTTFKIYFPSVQEAVVPAEQSVLDDSYRGTETILIAEDEEAVRKSAAEYLSENGYTVLAASSGPAALQIAQQHRGPIHLVLTDLVMPKMSGRELADRMKALHPKTKVVFMSGYSNNLLSSPQVQDREHTLLHKPFRLATLGQCIRQTLSSSE
jgi:PAS domain S-box-containing protein